MKALVFLILLMPLAAMAGKLDPSLSKGMLLKSCMQTEREFIKKSSKKEWLCSCVSQKVFARLDKAADLSDASKKLIIKSSIDFFKDPKDTYYDDPLSVVDSLFEYTDSCVSELKRK